MRDDETGDLWSPTALPIRREQSAVRRPSRPGLQPLRARQRTASQLDLLQFVPLDDPVKVSALTVENRSGAGRGACRSTAYAEWVLGPSRAGRRRFDRHRARRGDRGAPGPQPVERASFGGRVAFADLGGRQTRLDGRPDRVPRPQRLAPSGRPPWRGAPGCRERVGAGLDPCAALQTTVELAPGSADARSSSCSGEADDEAAARQLVAALPRAADLDAACAEVAALLGRRAGRRPGADARPLDGPPAQPLAPLPDARLPALGAVGVLPVGRRLRLPRPAPGRHGPRDRRGATWRASTCCARRPGSSSKATSSTGGTRHRAGASGPGSPTTCLWLAVRGRRTTSP